jgi:3-oxoacyl-[acyl-carrier protein] reductase
VLGLVRSVANQFGPDNITINNVGPGYTATARMKELAETRALTGGTSVVEYETQITKEIPLRAWRSRKRLRTPSSGWLQNELHT